MSKDLIDIGIKAKKASKIKIDSKSKNRVLLKFLKLIEKNKSYFYIISILSSFFREFIKL